MQDIYGPERDYGDICDEAYDKWKQADIERNAARQPCNGLGRGHPDGEGHRGASAWMRA